MSPARELDAVLFDLFDTLVLFERERLPLIQVNGRAVHSTAGVLHGVLASRVPGIGFPAFAEALLGSWQEAERIRDTTHREVSAPERFDMLFRRLGREAAGLPTGTVEALLAAHMHELLRAVVFPPHHRQLLRDLRARHRIALVSNFDYTPTARLVLEQGQVADLFDVVIVSADVGWRKPKAVIFDEALRHVGIAAPRALFVGDRIDIDVAGAQAVGMRTAWVNREGKARPDGTVPPDHEIRDLEELRAIAGI
ncbi:MAG: HAD family hydrolase [Candidatus Rokubacteria bacterium]|nr:HAD family hydrolase [Candidatus Rokubacteria bacterium]